MKDFVAILESYYFSFVSIVFFKKNYLLIVLTGLLVLSKTAGQDVIVNKFSIDRGSILCNSQNTVR
jgi:hypothetical protein